VDISCFDLNISLAPFNKDDFLYPVFCLTKSIYFSINCLFKLTIRPIQVPTYLLVNSSSNFGVFNNQSINPLIFASVILIFFYLLNSKILEERHGNLGLVFVKLIY